MTYATPTTPCASAPEPAHCAASNAPLSHETPRAAPRWSVVMGAPSAKRELLPKDANVQGECAPAARLGTDNARVAVGPPFDASGRILASVPIDPAQFAGA